MHKICFYLTLTCFVVRIYTEETFCGGKLNNALKKFCIRHNTPDQRIRRQVVTECCYNRCSVKYLVTNYCQSYDSEALENYLNKTKVLIKNEDEVNVKAKISKTKRQRRKAKRCSCKSKAKKKRFFKNRAILLQKNRKVPHAKVGGIEEFQTPFYVINRF